LTITSTPARTGLQLRALAIALALPLALMLGACGKPAAPAAADAPAAAASAPPAASAAAVATRPVLLLAPEDLRTVSGGALAGGPVITGSLQPQRRADLRAEVGAVVQQVLKENGEPVQRGELLVRLDDTALRDSLNSASEAVRAAGQAFEQVERQLQRLRTLQGQGMVTLQALEDAEVRRNNAQSDLVAARAREAAARQQLRRTEVRAPFAGVVSERKVSAGDTAQVGKELLKVIDPRSLRFEGLVTADRMAELKVGQAVRFRVNGFAQAEFRGKVRRVDATANAATRQVEVLVDFADPAQAPQVAGLFAEGRIETAAGQALMLPEAALVREGAKTHVWRVQGQRLQKVAVSLGERDARRGEFPVQAGLADGDVILRTPVGTLADGQAVELTRPAASTVGAAGLPAAQAGTATR
jgi:RND family efflux transporter MFP subunit